MPKTIIAEGKTSTEAIEKGLKELKATRNQNFRRYRSSINARIATKKYSTTSQGIISAGKEDFFQR